LQGDAELDRDQPEGRGSIVAITTVSGATMSKRVDYPKGHSARGGLTWDDLYGKWREGLPDIDVDKMLSTAQRLESLDDVNELLNIFRHSV
jgi:hypothetical protein